MLLFVKLVLSFQVLEKDFHPDTPAAQLKLIQIKELNKVLERLRADINVMGMDPLKLKEESDNFKREADLLRMERALLLARLEEKQKIDETNEGAVKVGQPEQDGMETEDVKVGQPEQEDATHVVVLDQMHVDNEVVVDAAPHQHQEVDGVNEEQAIGCKVAFEDFQLFLKFKNFLKAERQVNEVTVPIVQPIQDSSTEASVVFSQEKSFITLPDGRVIEIIDVGNVV